MKVLGAEHPVTLASLEELARTYRAAGKLDLALVRFKEMLANHPKSTPGDGQKLSGKLVRLGQSLVDSKRFIEAEPFLREGLAIREKQDPDGWPALEAQSLLGAALAGQKKYVDAERLLLAGHEGMKKRRAIDPAQGQWRLAEVVERLVQLYEVTDKKNDAAKWRKTLVGMEGKQIGPVHEVGMGLQLRGQLDKEAPDFVYQVKLAAGKTYVIDMVSTDQKAVDPFLILSDANGKKLAEDEHSGGGRSARIVHRAQQAGTYRIRATTLDNGVGTFSLTVRERAHPAKDKQE